MKRIYIIGLLLLLLFAGCFTIVDTQNYRPSPPPITLHQNDARIHYFGGFYFNFHGNYGYWDYWNNRPTVLPFWWYPPYRAPYIRPLPPYKPRILPPPIRFRDPRHRPRR